SFLRRILVVAQFTVSITILLGSFVVQKQIGFILNKDLGFDKENVLVIRRSDALDDQIEAFKHELSNLPEVVSVAHSGNIPGRSFSNNGTFVEGRPSSDVYLVWQGRVSYEFDKTFSLEMAEGRFFDKQVRSDSMAVVLNQAAVKALDLEENTLEKRLMILSGPNEYTYANIIGVLKDFNFQSLHENIEPMALFPLRGNPEGYIPVKLKGNENLKTITEIKNIWGKFNEDYPFDYFWMDDDFENQYKTEKRTGSILLIFSILSIFISCLGLFGLISFTSEKRTKEIGIRKSMGASIPGILTLLSKETLVLIGISAIFSAPVYLVINKWLQNFAFHFKFNPVVFALWLGITLIVILIVALVTVNIVAIGAARKNPADSLRHE
ncbi:MAG: FtsX-like permease family protein, partial [Bacteroidota bacterium]|nr:FtsX-like permease family protein [Bacteroidota bacterium]